MLPSPSPPRSLRCRPNNLITSRLGGQRGDGRDLKPQHFFLACPKCKSVKDASTCKLYGSAARAVYCTSCKTSATSTKWQCAHSVPWIECPEHRAWGFRCGGARRARVPKATTLSKEARQKAKHLRLARIGALGADSKLPNSASCLRKDNKKKYQKNKK